MTTDLKGARDCQHVIGRRTIGGVPGHEHVHPYGPQVCLVCGKTLDELLAAAFAEGQAARSREVFACLSPELVATVKRWLQAQAATKAAGQRSQEGATTHLAGTLDDYRNAPSEEGPLAYTWQDKPHRLVYDLVEEIERLRVALAAKEAELARVIAVAGEAVGTDPALRSSGCVDALATWAGTLQRDLSDVRAQLAAQQETIRDLSSLMWRAVNLMRGRIEPVDAGGWCPNCHCLGIHTEWCPLAVKEQCEAAVMAALKEQG